MKQKTNLEGSFVETAFSADEIERAIAMQTILFLDFDGVAHPETSGMMRCFAACHCCGKSCVPVAVIIGRVQNDRLF